jgi:hypothetical protein
MLFALLTVSVAASTPAAITAASTVEPAPAIPTISAVIVVAAVSESPVVTARGSASVASPTTTTGAEDDTCYHYYSDYDHNSQDRTHWNSPFTGLPRVWF